MKNVKKSVLVIGVLGLSGVFPGLGFADAYFVACPFASQIVCSPGEGCKAPNNWAFDAKLPSNAAFKFIFTGAMATSDQKAPFTCKYKDHSSNTIIGLTYKKTPLYASVNSPSNKWVHVFKGTVYTCVANDPENCLGAQYITKK